MTALQSIAMGLVLVVVDVHVGDWDVVPDLVGWVLVVVGVAGLRRLMPVGGLLAAGVVAGLVSVALVNRSFATSLPASTAWVLSLPEVVFNLLLASGLAAALHDHRPDFARRYRVFRWVFVALALAPAVVLGGGAEVLVVPLAILAVGTYVFFIVTLFRTASALGKGPKMSLPSVPGA